jgi:hypothetical protein
MHRGLISGPLETLYQAAELPVTQIITFLQLTNNDPRGDTQFVRKRPHGSFRQIPCSYKFEKLSLRNKEFGGPCVCFFLFLRRRAFQPRSIDEHCLSAAAVENVARFVEECEPKMIVLPR